MGSSCQGCLWWQPKPAGFWRKRGVRDKEAELAVAPEVLKCLDLKGLVVTGDALYAQKELYKQIVAAGGEYLFVVKDNQPTLREDIAPPCLTIRRSSQHKWCSKATTGTGEKCGSWRLPQPWTNTATGRT